MVIFSIALNCIAIGSVKTATAIFSITAPALDLSYIAVILAHQLYKSQVGFVEGPFTLGKWGKPVNIVAIVWVLFISTILFFPTQVPVTAANMYVDWDCASSTQISELTSARNYAVCVGAFIAAFALVWWRVSARGYGSIHIVIWHGMLLMSV